MAKRIGLEGKLYRNPSPLTAAAMGSGWDEVQNVRDLTISMDKEEADLTTRPSGAPTIIFKERRVTVTDASLEWESVWDPADADLLAIRDAFLNGAKIALAALDARITGEDGVAQGLAANFEIMKFGRDEPLTEGMKLQIVAKPREFCFWKTT